MSRLDQGRTAARFAVGLYRERWDRWSAARFRGDQLARLSLREGRRDPYAVYEDMRALGPMVPTRLGNWATTSHPVCKQVLRSRQFGVREEDGGVPGGSPQDFDLSFLSLNPPDHERLRRVAAPAFSPRMMSRYAATVDSTVASLLDAAERKGAFDLVADLAAPLPIAVITSMMGVEGGDVAAFQRYGAALGSALDGVTSIGQARRVIEANTELERLFERLFEERWREPREDLVSVIVSERGHSIEPREMVPMCSLLLIAGFETTVNLIGNATRALLAHPEQWRRLQEDLSLAPAVVEEVLRWDPPVQETARISFRDTEVAGVPVRRNQAVVLLLAAAGRDPEVFPDPARFDIGRTSASEHLAFSSGIHYCLGAPLARLEATAAVTALAQRMPGLRQTGRVVMRPSRLIRGPLHLPVAA
jgi:P450-derived glycosyltransferase activator